MDGTKSLIESKQFWGMVLGLAALVCQSFGLTQYTAWLADPATLQKIMTLSGFFGIFLGVFGRFTATKQVVSVLPQKAVADAPK